MANINLLYKFLTTGDMIQYLKNRLGIVLKSIDNTKILITGHKGAYLDSFKAFLAFLDRMRRSYPYNK